ncbi:hypothetical protein V3C99_007111 [Haemonchus contortus]
MQYFWINDIMVSVPLFSLVLLSSDLRQKILDSFGPNRNRRIVTISVTPRSIKKTAANEIA